MLNFINLYCDAPKTGGIFFQDSASPNMEALIELHNLIMFYLIIVLFSLGWIMAGLIIKFSGPNLIVNKYNKHGIIIELIWTLSPALILMVIALPSFKLLYLMDEVLEPSLTIIVNGNQWFWSYVYPEFLDSFNNTLEFESYLIPEPDLNLGNLRLLEVDNKLILPELTHIRLITSSNDVIHSFAVPALAIKCDAYPGRLNQISFIINRAGTFYGQCSEICGILHSSMPIVLQAVSLEKFLNWLNLQ